MRHMTTRYYYTFAALFSIGLGAVALSGCGGGPTNAGERSSAGADTADGAGTRVETVTVQQRDLGQSIELPGTVEGYERADLYAKVGGYLEEITVDIGDQVTQGQVLARLSIPEMAKQLNQSEAEIAAYQAEADQARAAIHEAEAQIASAKAAIEESEAALQEKQSQLEYRTAEHRRVEELVGRKSLNQALLDEAVFNRDSTASAVRAAQARIRFSQAELLARQSSVEKARADLQAALSKVELSRAEYERVETMSQYAIIKAPFNGMITKRTVDPGAFIQSADGNSGALPIFTLIRTDKVRISLHLPMAQVRWLDKGDRVTLDRINAMPGKRFEGEVSRFASSLDHKSRMMRVEIDLPNEDHLLVPGYYGYVTIHLEEMPETSIIPSTALLTHGAEDFVYVVEQGICRKRIVNTNFADGSIVGIASGLSPGENVIRAGGGLLSDGQQVVAVGQEKGI